MIYNWESKYNFFFKCLWKDEKGIVVVQTRFHSSTIKLTSTVLKLKSIYRKSLVTLTKVQLLKAKKLVKYRNWNVVQNQWKLMYCIAFTSNFILIHIIAEPDVIVLEGNVDLIIKLYMFTLWINSPYWRNIIECSVDEILCSI